MEKLLSSQAQAARLTEKLPKPYRFLLVDEQTGHMTARGKQILKQVPMAPYREPHEITGAALWLISEQASFVTEAVIPISP